MNGFCAVSRLPYLAGIELQALILRVIAIGALSCSGNTVFGDEEPADAGARDAHLRRARLSTLRVMHHKFIDGDEFCMELEYANATPDEIDEPGAVIREWQTIRFSKRAFDLAMFNGNRAGALTRLEIILKTEVWSVARVADLNEEQQRKLILAGRGDIHRLLDLVDSQRPLFEVKHTVRKAEAQNAAREIYNSLDEAAKLRKQVGQGPFGTDSLFEKNVRRMLTKMDYAKLLEERRKAKVDSL